MSRKGVTLIELVVSIAMGILLLCVIGWFFFQFNRQSENPIAAAGMEESTLSVSRWLQRALMETNLQSIRSISNDGGVVMESPRDTNDNLLFTPIGTVAWKKFCYFQVKQIPSEVPLPPHVQVGTASVTPARGELDYDEDATGVAVEPSGPPALTPSSPNTARHRVLTSNMLIDTGTSLMGCSVYYPDSSGNPQPFTTTQRGEPVCVALTLMDVSGRTGNPTVRKLLLQVRPQN